MENNPEQTHQPKMEIRLNGKDFEATPDNTSLYMHLGKLAMYNHIFITGKEDGEEFMARIWKHQPGHDQAANFMMKNGYPLHVNLREVHQQDLDSYDRMIAKQTEDLDIIPDDWL